MYVVRFESFVLKTVISPEFCFFFLFCFVFFFFFFFKQPFYSAFIFQKRATFLTLTSGGPAAYNCTFVVAGFWCLMVAVYNNLILALRFEVLKVWAAKKRKKKSIKWSISISSGCCSFFSSLGEWFKNSDAYMEPAWTFLSPPSLSYNTTLVGNVSGCGWWKTENFLEQLVLQYYSSIM